MQQKRGELEQKAMKYRRLAREITDRQTVEWILALANELEARSARPETISRDDQGPDRDAIKKISSEAARGDGPAAIEGIADRLACSLRRRPPKEAALRHWKRSDYR